jgi:Ni,Fe-hydrogenase I large subunit
MFCKSGGAGLRSASKTRIASYLGSIALTAPAVYDAFTHIYGGTEIDYPRVLRFRAHEENAKTMFETFAQGREATEVFPIFNRDEARKGVQSRVSRVKEKKELHSFGSLRKGVCTVGCRRTYVLGEV